VVLLREDVRDGALERRLQLRGARQRVALPSAYVAIPWLYASESPKCPLSPSCTDSRNATARATLSLYCVFDAACGRAEEREQREARLPDRDLPVLAVDDLDVAPLAAFVLDPREVRAALRDGFLRLLRAAGRPRAREPSPRRRGFR
jgi:hypothetical protein